MLSSETPGIVTPGLTVARRLGIAPALRADCNQAANCPDVFELANGDFAVIGDDVSSTLPLPADASRSETERTVIVPREVFLAAVRDLSGGL